MAATTASYDNNWPPRSSPHAHSSPDVTSPIYPERSIRPLPKRRLRSRLSPEQAGQLLYPPAPPTSTPLFSFPYSQPDKANAAGDSSRVHPEDVEQCYCGGDHLDHDSDYEEDEYDEVDALRSSPSHGHGLRQAGLRGVAGAGKPPPPDSAASSADGYESFENTNNKKKRKIPVSGGANGHHTTNLSVDLTNMNLAGDRGDAAAANTTVAAGTTAVDSSSSTGGYYNGSMVAPSTPGSGTGISGAGRGRYGRSGRGSSERRPLGASINGQNAYSSPAARRGQAASQKVSHPDQGIISAAIANAAHEPPLHKGNENVSLLQQQAAKPTPKTQFTFTCESDSSNKVVWPGQQHGSVPMPSTPSNVPTHPNSRIPLPVSNRRAQGTQTTPMPIPGGHQAPMPNAQSQQQQANPQSPTKPRRRRNPAREYALAARQRRLQQEYTNYHHPPSREDIWICMFCEYESIFGHPPEALIRQYEIKDRKERKRIEEKRRLLEKAKMKGRKNKKGKGGKNNNNNHAHQAQTQAQQAQAGYDKSYQHGDEYYEDEFEDVSGDAQSPPANYAPQPTTPTRGKENTGGVKNTGQQVHSKPTPAGGGGGKAPLAPMA